MVPVLYQQEYCAPLMHTSRKRSSEGASVRHSLERKQLMGVPNSGRFEFVGRGFEMLELEGIFQASHVVLLRGLKGQGKTAMACEWAQWMVWTMGRQRVFFTSFRASGGLRRTVMLVGQFLGNRFKDLDDNGQRNAVVNYLYSRKCLLIWDNFHSVTLRGKARKKRNLKCEQEEISSFLRKLNKGKTWILMSSRGFVSWLGCYHRHMKLKGLVEFEAYLFSMQILEQLGHDLYPPYKEFCALLRVLGGNPLCLQREIPRLLDTSLRDLTKELVHRLKTNNGVFYAHE